MKKGATYFLQVIIILFGLGVLAFLVIEPRLEGRNVGGTFVHTYFTDPFLVYVYVASILFFTVLWQALKLLTLVRKNIVFSAAALSSLRKIKYCAFIFAGAIVAADVYVRMTVKGDDDPAGAIMLGMVVTFISIVMGTVATVFERVIHKGVEMKSEHDLTV